MLSLPLLLEPAQDRHTVRVGHASASCPPSARVRNAGANVPQRLQPQLLLARAGRPSSGCSRRRRSASRESATIAAAARARVACCVAAARRDAPRCSAAQVRSATGRERYSAWFADERDGVIYFGLSPFWTEMRAHGGDRDRRPARAQRAPDRPLRARPRSGSCRCSSRGRPGRRLALVGLGRARAPERLDLLHDLLRGDGPRAAGTGEVEHFDALGHGLNEIALGPNGESLRHALRLGRPERAARRGDGALVEISPEGELVREVPLHARDGAFTRAQERRGRSDLGRGLAERRRDRAGRRGRRSRPSTSARDLARARAARRAARAHVRRASTATAAASSSRTTRASARAAWLRGGRELARVDLGPRERARLRAGRPLRRRRHAAIAFWSGRVELLRETNGDGSTRASTLEKPERLLSQPALFYSAFLGAERRATRHSTVTPRSCAARSPRSASLPRASGPPAGRSAASGLPAPPTPRARPRA